MLFMPVWAREQPAVCGELLPQVWFHTRLLVPVGSSGAGQAVRARGRQRLAVIIALLVVLAVVLGG
jgi:hypothetical protein